VFAKHLGGYNTSKTHWAIDTYMKDFNLKPKDFIWEVYVTDPATEPDSTKWETDIYYPLK
jgi:effector-binding domain-containing protein